MADRSKSSNAGAEVGVGVVVGAQTGVYVYAEASVGSSKSNSDSSTWQNTTLREHPEELEDFGQFEPGKNEAVLSSGDRLDVLFANGRQRLAVEVKTSKCSEDELMRGVYQCVKYRAIVRAEQLAMRQVPNGEAVLICPRAPDKTTKALIKRLNVNFHRVPVGAEQ